MKHLILDFINRWRWWLGAAVAFHLIYIVVVALEEKTKFFMWVIPAVGPALVMIDVRKGAANVGSLLPVRRKTLANTYFIQAVILPLAMVIAVMLLVPAALAPFKPTAVTALISLPHVALLSFVLSGTAFFCLAFMILGQSGQANKLVAAVAALSPGLIFFVAFLLPTDESIRQWSAMAAQGKFMLIFGGILGIASFFTPRLLVGSRAVFRPGGSPVRERTPARGIKFPNRTTSILEPWFMTLGFTLAAMLSYGAFVVLMFTFGHGGDVHGAMDMLFESSGVLWMGALFMLMAVAFFAGARFLLSLRLLRTLPLTGWGQTGIIMSIPMMIWLTAVLIMVVLLLATGKLNALVVFMKVCVLTLGLFFLAMGFLVRHGVRHMFVGIAVLFPLAGMLGILWTSPVLGSGGSVLSWSESLLFGGLLVAVGIWITQRAMTMRSETYRPANLIAPGGIGR